MSVFITISGVAQDVFVVTNRVLKYTPGRLAVAAVVGNAVFAAISGVSIASATAFSNIAYPEMRRYDYKRTLSLGVIASSTMLGMLIPPSILLIFWGVLTEISISKLFVAGIAYCIHCSYRFLCQMLRFIRQAQTRRNFSNNLKTIYRTIRM